MAVTILCPNLKCMRILKVPETTRGLRVRCGFCGQVLVVPKTTSSSPETAAPATAPQKS